MFLFTMVEFLTMTGAFDETEVRLNEVSLIPCPFFAILQVLLWGVFFAESKVTQGDGFFIILRCRFTKQIIWFVCRVPAPINHLTAIIHEPCQLDADNPASIRLAFLSKVVRTSSFPTWMD